MIQRFSTAQADQTSKNQSQVQNHSADETGEEFRQLINAKLKNQFPACKGRRPMGISVSSLVLQLDKLIRKSTFEHKLSTFGNIVYQTCLNTFGVKQHE